MHFLGAKSALYGEKLVTLQSEKVHYALFSVCSHCEAVCAYTILHCIYNI